MAYDPQANRRRPKPEPAGPAPVDALLGDDTPTAPAPLPEGAPPAEPASPGN